MFKHILVLFVFISMSSFGCKSSKGVKDSEQTSQDSQKKEEKNTANKKAEPKFITNKRGDKIELVEKSEAEWMNLLSKEQFYVLRKKGTERAFSGDLWDIKKEGLYSCSGCDMVLFTSGTKFDSGTGWPSFFKPDDDTMIKKATDHDLGYPRTEVMCAKCGGHLGHVFDDGPPPTGLRYCINSLSLKFIPALNSK